MKRFTMSNTPPDNSVEQRRKLLKGALAASGVVTMGYSGPALASFNCIQKTTTPALTDGLQLVQSVSTSSGSPNWAWVQVTIQKFRVTETNADFYGFVFPDGTGGTIYEVTLPNGANWGQASSNPFINTKISTPQGSERTGWLLVLFDEYGNYMKPDPYEAELLIDRDPTTQEQTPQPAAASCISSLNAQLPPGTISYGG